MDDAHGVYRTPALRHPPRIARDDRVRAGLALGALSVLLAAGAFWYAVVTGIFARPSIGTLIPAIPGVLCGLWAGTLGWRVARTGHRKGLAVLIGALAAVGIAVASIAATAYATGSDPPPMEPLHLDPLFHC